MNIKINDISLYYEVKGEGNPLIFIHGNSEDHHTFDVLSDALIEQYKMYLIDSRAHGQSQKNVIVSFDLMADDMIKFCDALKLEDITFVGYSDGGIVGLKMAVQKPQLFKKMIICGANFYPHGVKNPFYYEMKKYYKKNKSPLIKMMLKEPHFKTKDLKNINIDLTILAGEKDLIKESHTKKLHKLIKSSKCHILKGEDHGSYVANSTKLTKFLL